MRLKREQQHVVISAFESLFARVRYLRDQRHVPAPADDQLEELFTNIEEYAVDADYEVNEWLDLLFGLAIGLGFDSTRDLYRSYREGFEQDDPFDVALLIIAASKALVWLATPSSLFRDEIARELGAALVPFRTLH